MTTGSMQTIGSTKTGMNSETESTTIRTIGLMMIGSTPKLTIRQGMKRTTNDRDSMMGSMPMIDSMRTTMNLATGNKSFPMKGSTMTGLIPKSMSDRGWTNSTNDQAMMTGSMRTIDSMKTIGCSETENTTIERMDYCSTGLTRWWRIPPRTMTMMNGRQRTKGSMRTIGSKRIAKNLATESKSFRRTDYLKIGSIHWWKIGQGWTMTTSDQGMKRHSKPMIGC